MVSENQIAAIGLLSMIIVAVSFTGYLSDNELGSWAQPHYTFSALTWQKQDWYQNNVHGWFENGTVVWNNETDNSGLWVAIVIPVPLPLNDLPALGDKAYVVIAYSGNPLRIGDVVKVRGYVDRAQKDGVVVYYVRTDRVVKTGALSISDPNFHDILEVIQYDRELQADMTVTIVVLVVVIVTVLMPSNYG